MSVQPPSPPAGAQRYLDLVGLMGLMRVAMFEAFGDRRFWDERYYDLFTSMLAKQLRGSVSTLEEMTGSITGVSYSTKVRGRLQARHHSADRMIEDARKAGIIEAVNRSDIELDQPLDSTSARKVFFLTESAMSAMVKGLDDILGDIRAFSGRTGDG